MQKMMTKAIEAATPRFYEQDGKGYDSIAYAHYFSCFMDWDWYMTEYNPDEKLAFGFVKGDFPELGYFSIAEFEDINRRYGLNVIERDISWTPCKLKDVA